MIFHSERRSCFGRFSVFLVVSLIHFHSVTAEEANPAIAAAMEGVSAATARVSSDPMRPQYHFMPPAQWMNDPNGPILYKGRYHIFYQHNPYGDAWGNMHWGHAVSRDLVRWEHMPIALWPSKEKGEEHCFSGCAALGADGKPMLLYTSIGNRFPEQWAAVPMDDELRVWKKHAKNPILSNALHGDTKVYEWRDPYVFSVKDRKFLITGGNINESAGGGGAVFLYESKNRELTEWEYRSAFFIHPDKDVKNIECPNLVQIGGKWVLIVSPHRSVEYFAGDLDLDLGAFIWKTRGVVDYGNYYAPNGLYDKDGSHVLWGWVNGFPAGKGWNGCLSLPRRLGLDSQGRLVQTPVEQLGSLRGNPARQQMTLQNGTPFGLNERLSRSFEIQVHIANKTANRVVIRFAGGDTNRSFEIVAEKGAIFAAGTAAKLKSEGAFPDKIQVYVDHSVVEVYTEDGLTVVTKVIDVPMANARIEFRAEGGIADIECEVWPIEQK
jgi:beta-fructofuranosidase